MPVTDPLPGGRAVHLALAEKLDLDPRQIAPGGFTIMPLTESVVRVEWTGFSRLTWEEYRAVVEGVQEERRG